MLANFGIGAQADRVATEFRGSPECFTAAAEQHVLQPFDQRNCDAVRMKRRQVVASRIVNAFSAVSSRLRGRENVCDNMDQMVTANLSEHPAGAAALHRARVHVAHDLRSHRPFRDGSKRSAQSGSA
jgi:hypothetical protein